MIEAEIWARENPGPETAAHLLRLKASILIRRDGASPLVGELFAESWRLARRLSPGLHVHAVANLLCLAHVTGDDKLARTTRRSYKRLQSRYADDPAVQAWRPYVCAWIGYLSVLKGAWNAAVLWFDRSGAHPEEMEDQAFPAWSLAMAAHACIKRHRLAEAASRLDRAAQIMPPDRPSAAIIPIIQAEWAVAGGDLTRASALLGSLQEGNPWDAVSVLAACTWARLYAKLQNASEVQRWIDQARSSLKPGSALWLQSEISALVTH